MRFSMFFSEKWKQNKAFWYIYSLFRGHHFNANLTESYDFFASCLYVKHRQTCFYFFMDCTLSQTLLSNIHVCACWSVVRIWCVIHMLTHKGCDAYSTHRCTHSDSMKCCWWYCWDEPSIFFVVNRQQEKNAIS